MATRALAVEATTSTAPLASKVAAKVPATMEAKAATTRIRVRYAKMINRVFARVDMFVTPEREIYFNEINTIPGFTSISMYPKLFAASGIPYSQLIDNLLQLAVEAL